MEAEFLLYGVVSPFQGLDNLLNDLPGASLADSLCPGLLSCRAYSAPASANPRRRSQARFALGFHLSDFQPLKMVRRALRGVPASARISIHLQDVIIPGMMTMQSALSGLPKEKVLRFSVRASCDGVRIGPAT